MCVWNWFKTDGNLSVIQSLSFAAGVLISRNNATLAKEILPVAETIKKTIDAGGNTEGMNVIFQQAVTELLAQVKDPLIVAAIMAVFAQIKFDPKIPTQLDNVVIKEIVDFFVNGMEATVVK